MAHLRISLFHSPVLKCWPPDFKQSSHLPKIFLYAWWNKLWNNGNLHLNIIINSSKECKWFIWTLIFQCFLKIITTGFYSFSNWCTSELSKSICAKTCLTELLLRKHYDMVESSHWSRWNTDQAGKWWCSVYGQDARCTAVKAVVIKGNVKVGTHEVTLKRILGIETNTAGMSRKWAGSPPQNGVRWQWFEETFPSTYKLQY